MWRLRTILFIYIMNITLCLAIRYDCDKRNVSCGCAFKNVEIDETNNIEETIPYSWSMMVSIRYDCHQNGNLSTHCCAGTILNERYILTAARCFDPTDNSSLLAGNITIAANIHSLSQNCPLIRVIDQIFIHPNWTVTDEALHNIAILRLAEPLDFQTDFILSSACLPSRMDTSIEMISNSSLAVVGWSVFGNVRERKDDVLQQLIVYPIDYNDSICSRSANDQNLLFCAGRYGAACFPEVGGPAFQWIGHRWELVGIESYAMDGCPRVGYKGLFLRVAAYSDWIESILNSDTIMPTTESITTEKLIYNYECNRNIPCGCGYSNVVFRPTRIIGGEDVIEHSWSMIVSLRLYGRKEHFCAGTLLSNSYILTAAHCVDRFSLTHPVNISIIAGVTNRSDSEAYQRDIDRIYIHENYTDRPHFLNDIALLHMNRPLYFQHNPILAKTCIKRINSSIIDINQHPKTGARLVVIGWGAMQPGSFLQSEYLQQIRISTIDNQDPICQKTINDNELQFCAGLYNDEKDACLGDSGGPILYWTGQYWEQVGIIGHNFQCGRPGHPGVYTRLAKYWEWMENILNNTNEYLEPPIPVSTTTTSTTFRPTMITPNRTRRTTTSSDTLSTSSVTLTDISRGTNLLTIPSSLLTITYDHPTVRTAFTSISWATNRPPYTSRKVETLTSLSTSSKPTTSSAPVTTNWFTNILSTTTRSLITSKTINTLNTWPLSTITASKTLLPSITMTSNTPITRSKFTRMPSSTQKTLNTIVTFSSPMNVTFGTSVTKDWFTRTSSMSIETSHVPLLTTVITTERSQAMSSSTTTTVVTTNPLSPHEIIIAPLTTVLPRKKITYECNRIPNECGCSLANVVLSDNNQRMSSIHDTTEDSFPYSWSMLVSIRENNTKHICIGTILSDSFILTTAQCVINYRQNPNNINIAAGIHSLSQHITTQRTVIAIYIHENYTANIEHLHNIAILRLDQPLEVISQPLFSKTCLSDAQSFMSTEQTTIITVGWPYVTMKKATSDSLQQLSTKSITNPNTTCFHSNYNDIYQFCAGLSIDSTNTCKDNSGEPIFIYRNKYWEQIGMLSKTHRCSSIGHSGIYTRLSAYTNWIQHVLKTTPIPQRRPTQVNNSLKLRQQYILILNIFVFIITYFSSN
ncbi:hypothetical protein I4U23_023600 [Adineta vaga]|nr:hypothetical protein I4U23_023600 [Adineta vaga]